MERGKATSKAYTQDDIRALIEAQEKAKKDEVSKLVHAEREGRKEGLKQGVKQGCE